MPDNKTPKYQYDHYDFGDMLDSAVEAGSKIGSSVLGSIADALAQAGDAMSRPQPDSFAAWKRRLKRKWKNGGQSVGVVLTAVGWTFTGCFGITALVLGILTAVGAGPLGLSPQDFIALPILTAVFYPATLGFLFMAIVGMKKLTYFSRLRRLLRAANDWTCDLPALARKAQIKQEKAYETVAKAVANGDLPNAAISDDYSTLYLDDSLMPTAAKPAAAPQAEPAEPLTDAEQFRREGMDFLNYLKVCRGKLGTDADEELAAMQKTCASIMGFVHNHPEQLNRVRRFREYYLPTTRKLLDTAQGLGDTDSANAAEIRRDITGILHTLNQAYEKLYDTLLQDVSMDVSTEIDTLEAMLRQDGLTHDFEADLRSGCLFFYGEIWKNPIPAGQTCVEQWGAVDQEEGDWDQLRHSEGFDQAVAGQKGGTGIIRKGEKVRALFLGNASLPHQIGGELRTYGIAAEKTSQQAKSPVWGQTKESPGQGSDELCNARDPVQGDQQAGENKKGQQHRKQGVEPEQQSVCGRHPGLHRVQK